MIHSKAKFRRCRITGVAWFAGFVFLMVAYWWVMTNFVIRDFYDPSYVQKSERLHDCVNQNPQRPLWLVFGSSRVEFGLRPEVLEEGAGDPKAPVMFNFGMGGAGMFRQFIYLRRLLEEGIKPQRVGIEIFTLDLNHPLISPPDTPALQVRARRDELGDYAAYTDNPSGFLNNWKMSRWNPAYEYGMRMEYQTLTLRLIPLPWLWHMQRNPYDKRGWIPTPMATRNDSLANLSLAKQRYEHDFGDFKVAPKTDAVLRKMLDLCKTAGASAFLFRMPDNGELRAMPYTAKNDEALASYLGKIQGEYHVPVIDASAWIANEGFSDAYHLNPTGGAEFTRRLAGELLALKP